ncbi:MULTISPECIES: LA2681 family HEPN domain-containing protein [Bacteria]|uniref:LA2681 family HEPN domain-containing protein n=1 Tax=Bacteria TaxID=2 RepID=UPI0028AB7D4D|nr:MULTISPECIES: LA2681 family HEPN domain-containing protein [Enterococcus]
MWDGNSPLLQIAESNYILKAVYWMKKDLYGNSISDYNDYMNPVLNRTYEIRNVMEHRYLKILSYANIVSEEYKIDKLATIISVEEFHDLAVNLLRACREAIILLVMLINVEEKRKSTNSEGLIIPGRPLPEYKDDWKL